MEMKEQTILQCAKCLNHTTLIETDTQESIMKAIDKHKHCGMCGHNVMLCFDSRMVKVGKGKQLSWRSANAARTSKPTKRRRNKTVSRRPKSDTLLLQPVRP